MTSRVTPEMVTFFLPENCNGKQPICVHTYCLINLSDGRKERCALSGSQIHLLRSAIPDSAKFRDWYLIKDERHYTKCPLLDANWTATELLTFIFNEVHPDAGPS